MTTEKIKVGRCDNPSCGTTELGDIEGTPPKGMLLTVEYTYNSGGRRGKVWICSPECATQALESWRDNPED